MGNTHPSSLRQAVSIATSELPCSFLSRSAWANGFTTADEFCAVTGLARNHVFEVPDMYAETLSGWTRSPVTALQEFSMPKGKIIPFGFSSVKRTQLQMNGARYCPHCLHDDVRGGADNPRTGYIRAPWHWKMISHCPEHGCLIAQDKTGILHLENLGSLIAEKERVEISEPTAADRYFYDRLAKQSGPSFLDEFPVYVAAEFCAVIGQFHKGMHTQTLNERIAGGFENYDVRREGFAIAAKGRDAVWDFLTEYVADASKRIHLPRRIYSPFLRWWSANKHNGDYKVLFKLVQDHAEEHVALEPGDAFVTLINKRRVYTVATAAKHYALSEERVRRALQTKMGVRVLPYFLRRAQIHHTLLEAASYVATSEVAIALDCSMRMCDDLIKAGLIATVPNRDCEGRVYRLVHQLEIDRFIRELGSVVDTDLDTTDMVSAAVIFRTCKCRIVDILTLAFSGKLSRVGLAGPRLGINGLFFDAAEIRHQIARSKKGDPAKGFDHDLVDMRAARLRLGIKKLAMEGLVEAGHIGSIEMESGNSWEGRVRKMIKIDDLDAFAELHISLDEIVEKKRLDRATLMNDLNEKGVCPVFEGTNRTIKFYKKVDVEAVGLL
jgi:hypothetical protein